MFFTKTSIPKDLQPSSPELIGWVPESTGRGTLSLIFGCAFTISLCTWVVIHPRHHERSLLRMLHKIALFVKAIIAPEFIAVEGLQEWNQARRMVRDCAEITQGQLKLSHAFYIGMLAFRYRTPRGRKVIWPNQFTWLLRQGLVNWEDHARYGLDESVIRDKSNSDSTVKLAALVQVTWFVAQSIMRTAHALPLSPLESMTLSYVPLFAVTYFFWWVKPKDVLSPSIVDLPIMSRDQMIKFESMAVSNAFDNEGLGQQDRLSSIWALTPRVFEKEAEDAAVREYQEKATRRAPVAECTTGDSTEDVENRCNTIPVRPKETVLAHWDPELYRSRIWPLTCFFGTSFPALHLISWYSIFPTLVEQWMWRITSLVSIVTMLIFMHFEKVVLRWGGFLTIISIVSPALYLVSRVVALALVVAAFRAADPAIYDTYVAANYWIHVI